MFPKSGASDSLKLVESLCPGPNKPPFIGLNAVRSVGIYVIDPDVAQKMYTEVNRYQSKPQFMRDMFSKWAPSTIIFQKTEDPDYRLKRKTLSSAFFKSKTKFLVDIIKEVTLDFLKETENETEFDLPTFTNTLEARIIMNIGVGRDSSKALFPFEKTDGSVVKITLAEHIDEMTNDLVIKFKQPHNFINKSLMKYNLTKFDRRF